ncbi:MAG: amidohydrolase family protein [Planctomycetes bacterium]|nr:amidohydrolase family protein [Planctomycetota bacterium]
MRNTFLSLSAAALLGVGAVTAQSARPVAFTNARIHTVSGKVVENGTLVVRNGKIEAVGADVTIPAGARIVDASGKTIMPGLVSAWSRAGLNPPQQRGATPTRGGRRFRRQFRPSSGGRAVNQAATKVVDALYTRQPIFHDLLEVGVTSLALNPDGGGFPGLGAVLNPAGKNRGELAVDDEAFVQIEMQRNSAAKKLLKETFEKAKKVVEEREKPPEPPKKEEPKKPAEAKPADKKPDGKQPEGGQPPKNGEQPAPKPAPKEGDEKQDPKKPEQPPQKQAPKPEQKPKPKPKDPNLEVLADLLQGKRRAIVQIDSAADLLHWRHAIDDDVKFPRMVAVTRHDTRAGTIDMVIDHLEKWQCPVLLPPSLTTLPSSSYVVHPAKKLHDAGIEIGFAIGESTGSVRSIFYRLMELVRAGLPADVAIKAVTLVPAKALGIDKRTGTLETGKDADLLVFDGDPLSPTGKLEQVWLRGQKVENN